MDPRLVALADMRAEGLDVSLIAVRKIVIVSKYSFVKLDDGRRFNGETIR